VSNEQFYQYYKFTIIDPVYADIILAENHSHKIKHISGKGVYLLWKYSQVLESGVKLVKIHHARAFDAAKKIFDSQSLLVMRAALHLKFSQNPHLRDLLAGTGDMHLAEIGRFKRDYWSIKGENMLGRLLMEIRENL